MKNKLLLSILSLSLWGASYAQQLERCGTEYLIQYNEQKHQGYAESVQRAFDEAKDNISGNRNSVYEIPVVVHIVYNTPEQNLADSVIYEQIATLNEDYRRLNADTINMRADFQPHVGDAMIQFELADFDENGNPTTGITRTSTNETSFFNLFGGGGVAEGVKSTTDGGIDPWDQSKYLNIWVCNMEAPIFGPSILGYASPPSGLSHWPSGQTNGINDGVVIQFQVFGRNNPNILDMGDGPLDIRGRTVTHEVGHYLGLRHIWGDGGCSDQDGIPDTPNADDQSNFDCDDTKNTCTDNIGGIDLPDMIENYMDYSAETCQNSFTAGQVDMMRSVIDNHRSGLLDNGALSVHEEEENQIIASIYPNPTASQFNVVLNNDQQKDYLIEVYAVTGQHVSQKKMNSNQITLDATYWEKGTYIIRVKDNHGVYISNHKLTVL